MTEYTIVTDTLLTEATVLVFLFICNWGGVNGLHEEGKSIPNAKASSSIVLIAGIIHGIICRFSN